MSKICFSPGLATQDHLSLQGISEESPEAEVLKPR